MKAEEKLVRQRVNIAISLRLGEFTRHERSPAGLFRYREKKKSPWKIQGLTR